MVAARGCHCLCAVQGQRELCALGRPCVSVGAGERGATVYLNQLHTHLSPIIVFFSFIVRSDGGHGGKEPRGDNLNGGLGRGPQQRAVSTLSALLPAPHLFLPRAYLPGGLLSPQPRAFRTRGRDIQSPSPKQSQLKWLLSVCVVVPICPSFHSRVSPTIKVKCSQDSRT